MKKDKVSQKVYLSIRPSLCAFIFYENVCFYKYMYIYTCTGFFVLHIINTDDLF